MEYDHNDPSGEMALPSPVKPRVLLYTAVFFVLFSIYTTDSFSAWKFLAVIIPLSLSFIPFRKFWFLLPLGFILWFGVMLTSVGTIYNHDLLYLTAPIVCPEGYRAEVRTIVQNPVPGETYTSSHMRCINDEGKFINPGFKAHFVLLALYASTALILFFITGILISVLKRVFQNFYYIYLTASAAYCFLLYEIWIQKDQIIGLIRSVPL